MKNLLKKAREVKHSRCTRKSKFTKEEMELAAAYAREEIGFAQVAHALDKPRIHPGPVYTFLARALSQYVRELK
jgi:hypothetical protein